MGRHGFFIFFAYAITGVAVVAMIAYVVAEHRRLRSALSKFPPREGDERD